MNIIQDDNWVEVEGKGCWGWFVKKAVQLHLKVEDIDYLLALSIWMKYDNSMFEEILRYNIKYIKTFNNTESNKMFHVMVKHLLVTLPDYNGGYIFTENHQGPTRNHLIQNIKIYDKIHSKYIKFKPNISSPMDTSFSLPLFGVSIIKKFYLL